MKRKEKLGRHIMIGKVILTSVLQVTVKGENREGNKGLEMVDDTERENIE